MRKIGFSTGALAKGDFRRGIELQQAQVDAVELSALRESELDSLLGAIPSLGIDRFKYVSLHAPSRLEKFTEQQLVARLMTVTSDVQSIIVHPDIVENAQAWIPLGEKLVLENMDQRKAKGRTAVEMKRCFAMLPKARFCFDIGHARQVDPTLGVAIELLMAFGKRLAEIHISEVDSAGNHVQISCAVMMSFRKIAHLIPTNTPAIIESVIDPNAIGDELEMTRASLCDIPLEKALFCQTGPLQYSAACDN